MQTALVFFTDRLQKKIRSDSLVSRSLCTKLMRQCNWELVLTSFQIKERKTNFELFLPLYKEVINELQKFRISKFSRQLPDSCTEPWTCGTQASGWLRGGHPSMEEGLVHRNVCFSWNDNCCFAEVQALVKHCYGYYVYKLQPTALEFKVKARYCVG